MLLLDWIDSSFDMYLIHLQLMFPFYTPWRPQKTFGIRGIERKLVKMHKHWIVFFGYFWCIDNLLLFFVSNMLVHIQRKSTALSHFQPMFHFYSYSPWKRQKIIDFLIFSGGIEVRTLAENDLNPKMWHIIP